MGLSIKNPATEQRIRELAAVTGESLTEAIDRAVTERLERVGQDRAREVGELVALVRGMRRLPVRDARPTRAIRDELYDESGAPR